MKIGNWVILKFKIIRLGDLPVRELTILENKKYFSLKWFYFCKVTSQERFHTHAFQAYSFRLWGNYIEKILDENFHSTDLQRSRSRLIYIQKDRYHQITNSNGCSTIMLTGKWGPTYKEYLPETREIVTSTDGRVEILREKLD